MLRSLFILADLIVPKQLADYLNAEEALNAKQEQGAKQEDGIANAENGSAILDETSARTEQPVAPVTTATETPESSNSIIYVVGFSVVLAAIVLIASKGRRSASSSTDA